MLEEKESRERKRKRAIEGGERNRGGRERERESERAVGLQHTRKPRAKRRGHERIEGSTDVITFIQGMLQLKVLEK